MTPGASREHVKITVREGRFLWEDLGSTNGTLVNGAAMLNGELRPGDSLQIGDTVLRFEAEDTPAQAATPDTTLFKQTIVDQTGRGLGGRGRRQDGDTSSRFLQCHEGDRVELRDV